MPGPKKRLPGESNAEYGGDSDPNSEFLGTQSLDGGGDPGWSLRLWRALDAWRDRRKRQRKG